MHKAIKYLLNTIKVVFYIKLCYNYLKYKYFNILGLLMLKGKKVKAIEEPSFDEALTTESIGLFIKARRTQQGLSTKRRDS